MCMPMEQFVLPRDPLTPALSPVPGAREKTGGSNRAGASDMHFEPRLWSFTEGLRLRILGATAIGLAAVGLGIARLALLGWLIGQVFAGRDLKSLVMPILLIAGVMILRGMAEHGRVAVAHETAARVQKRLRREIY